ncbi:MAG: hypothetical protein LAQ69_27270 [Acidobacteriia bacterium]|nr:hypothetical protein [Terriglobia bacterium]
MQQLPVRSVRLVVLNLAEQRDLYRSDGFQLRDLTQVEEAIYQLQLEMIDYRLLQKRTVTPRYSAGWRTRSLLTATRPRPSCFRTVYKLHRSGSGMEFVTP